MTFQIDEIIPETKIKIDRLTMCVDEPSKLYTEQSIDQLNQIGSHGEPFGTIVKPGNRYEIDVQLTFPLYAPGKHSIAKAYFQVGPKLPYAATYRLDFNPSNFSPQDWAELEKFIATYTRFEWPSFVSMGRVTRLDLAIDMPSHQLTSVLFGSNRKQKHAVYCDRNSYPETQYFGASNRSRIVVYDKQKPPFDAPLMRLEVRLAPKRTGDELITLKNPFRGIQAWDVSILDCLPPSPYKQQIEDSIRLRGINRGLAELPKADRNVLRKALKGSGYANVQFDSLWEEWPSILAHHNLAPVDVSSLQFH